MVAAEELFELGATVPDVMEKIGINGSDAEALRERCAAKHG
jgi:hypothetical protein